MPLQRDQPRARETRRTALYACQKVIVKRRISSTAMLLPLFFMLHSSSNKFMTTLMLSGRQRNLPHLLLMFQRKGFGAGIISTLSACGFLEMLLHLPRERTGAMGAIKNMHDFESVLFQEMAEGAKDCCVDAAEVWREVLQRTEFAGVMVSAACA